MTDEAGGFYSAQDAGDYDEEGDYYTWKKSEIQDVLTGEEYARFDQIFRVTPKGNFEHNRNVLHMHSSIKHPDPEFDPLLKSAYQQLLTRRDTRKKVRLDDKVLTAWNGFMIAAMSKGYQVLGDTKYLDAAQKAAVFLKQSLRQNDGRLYRRWWGGEAGKDPIVNDYAYLIYGLIELYQSDFDPTWITWSLELQRIQDTDFWDAKNGGYFFTTTLDPTLLAPAKKYDDMAMPTGNSIAAINLLKLRDLTYSQEYDSRVIQLFRATASRVDRMPFAHAQLLTALDYMQDRSKEVAIIQEKGAKSPVILLKSLRSKFLPNQVIALSQGESDKNPIILLNRKKPLGQTTVYICEQGSCKQPLKNIDKIMKTVDSYRSLRPSGAGKN
ncbi:MAG: thioredoxin domain-containing protein [Candidatus Lindowbacteria bacterium]|nr:thioredoxin domain-containing protein [Candidatus Lindowbacteria bacterium]